MPSVAYYPALTVGQATFWMPRYSFTYTKPRKVKVDVKEVRPAPYLYYAIPYSPYYRYTIPMGAGILVR